jgi:hypothetical protein
MRNRFVAWLLSLGSTLPDPDSDSATLALSHEDGRLRIRYAGQVADERLRLFEEDRTDSRAQQLIRQFGLTGRGRRCRGKNSDPPLSLGRCEH